MTRRKSKSSGKPLVSATVSQPGAPASPQKGMQTEEDRICVTFKEIVKENPEMSSAVAAVKALVESIKWNTASTMQEFTQNLESSRRILKKKTELSPVSVAAGCDLFLHWIGKYQHDISDLDACRQSVISKGENLVHRSDEIRNQVAAVGLNFVKDNAIILIHSYSRVVMKLLKRAAQANKRFTVYVTESRPENGGKKAAQKLREEGIVAYEILDSAVGYFIENVDMVMVGAEGVVENGGIINQIGTYQIAVVAKAANKPFYVVTESYKFVRLFPLNQSDLPKRANVARRGADAGPVDPSVDYTPPAFITLLFTDLGVLTPSGVSDELSTCF
ncbi:hypothetical protein BJ742DRAFT_140115 [Cladochytrium replicatum]|nr:hypothetical protein BJ742DRAFT_140115 [Cladochytrium replicatum]